MSAKQKSQRGFVAVTLITVLAIALVIVVYSTILATFNGQPVMVVTQGGDIWYCQNTTGPWTATLSNIGNSTEWYAMFNTTNAGHKGPVNMTWVLQEQDGSWADVSPGVNQTTTVILAGTEGQVIYASTDGGASGQMNWGASTTTAGTYRIEVTITAA